MRLSPEAIELLAREYALGTLHGGARRRFEALQRESQAVAHAVAGWQQRLAHLAQSVPAIQPSPALWQGLEQRLFAPAAGTPRAGWRFWRWMLPSLGGAFAGAALCLLVLTQQPQWLGREVAQGEGLPQSYVGLLSDAAGKPVVLASSTRHGRQLQLKLLQPIAVPTGQVARLWALPSDGRAPFVVGVVPAGGKASITLADSAERLFAKVPRLGVRLEPADAALAPPSAAAENFVVSGPCVKLW
ncbi:anti-sigma factor [Ideonella sp. BN130291]|uniref:anti-sigma factor n=1 Tax=Ideonella sp. BN130291 TaxID=3112940 RepID=UPI002E25FBEA|nr:anti-sigma factor [Ideonella sp. BN130291]